jgi:hypothetical protein
MTYDDVRLSQARQPQRRAREYEFATRTPPQYCTSAESPFAVPLFRRRALQDLHNDKKTSACERVISNEATVICAKCASKCDA